MRIDVPARVPPRYETRPEPAVGPAPTHAATEPTYLQSPPAPAVNGVRRAVIAERNATAYEMLKWGGGLLTAVIVGMIIEHEYELLDQSYRISGLERVVNELGDRMRAVEERIDDALRGRPSS